MKKTVFVPMWIFGLLLILSSHSVLFSQISYQELDFVVQDRGMLHTTLYNTGMTCQEFVMRPSWQIIPPYMKWPPYSRTVIDGVEYDGQNLSLGSGIFVSANYLGDEGWTEEEGRLAAFIGGVGAEVPEPTWGRYVFPISFEQIKNYPVLEDGTLNQNYDPEEAEQITIAEWHTSVGISGTKVSRSWSFPDYDDFIIHEYTFENTGVYLDQNTGELKQHDTTLVDVKIDFHNHYAPSQLGTRRNYTNPYWWTWISEEAPTKFWDPDYWLSYNQVTNAHGQDTLLAGNPEPKRENFLEFANSGKNGGGLLSPQAAGYCVLYYDTDKLSIIDTLDASRNQSPQFVKEDLFFKDSTGKVIDLGPDGKIKQPYQCINYKDHNSLDRAWSWYSSLNSRTSGTEVATKNPAGFSEKNPLIPKYLSEVWEGRVIPYRQARSFSWGGIREMGFGLYYLELGDKIEFTIAEVVGYGADPGKNVFGGPRTPRDPDEIGRKPPVSRGWFWDRPIKVEGQIVTENYVADFGIPDYVNSDVIFVQDVAHKAFETYMGHEIPAPDTWDRDNPNIWPENHPKDGVYKIPVPVPAPLITTFNTDTGTVVVTWNRAVEDFENIYSGHVTGKLQKFHVYRSISQMGPWELIVSIARSDVNGENEYLYDDNDRTFVVGETRYYAVTSVDEHGNESGKTNIVRHNKAIGATELTKVHVVPNPYVIESGFTGIGAERQLGIYGLPEKCTIYIYSYAGQRIFEIEHNANEYSENFEQITRNNQDLASGVYFFVVTTPSGKKYTGKFIVVK